MTMRAAVADTEQVRWILESCDAATPNPPLPPGRPPSFAGDPHLSMNDRGLAASSVSDGLLLRLFVKGLQSQRERDGKLRTPPWSITGDCDAAMVLLDQRASN